MTFTRRSGQRRRAVATLAGGTVLVAGSALAAPFLYSPGDLVVTFRQVGAASELVVNVGRATNYNALPPGTSVPIGELPQLTSTFPSLNGLNWSVAGVNRPPIDPNYPLQTLWISAARLSPEAQSTPWLRKGQFVQGNVGSQVDGIGYNAAQASSLLPAGPDNTATAVVIPANHNFAIGPVLGSEGDYVGNFQGRVESTTPIDFADNPSAVSRADLYELIPGTSAAGTLDTPGRYLGFFELRPDGTLSFHTTVTVQQPQITAISRNGDVTSISFSSVQGTTYQLRTTNSAGLTSPISSWSAGATVVGDGQTKTIEETHTEADRFFVIEALP